MGRPATLTADEAKRRTSESKRRYSAAKSTEGRTVRIDPSTRDVERYERCRLDLKAFCEAYFKPAFYLGWSQDQLKVISKMQDAVLLGGLSAYAMPRGSGKTTLSRVASMWALLYGHRRWVCVIGATDKHARRLLGACKKDLTYNADLADDFPMSVQPVAAIQNDARKSTGQLYVVDGVDAEPRKSEISWTADRVVMPSVEGSECSGSIITVCGITGNIRGQVDNTMDGEVLRPDLMFLDDPQTKESAGSAQQNQDRLDLLNGDILGMAGPNIEPAGLMACTVIYRNDMADTILDRKVSPQWRGERTKMLISEPENEELWQDYLRIRIDDLNEDGNGEKATEFYRQNQEAMDAGAEVSWPERFPPKYASAIESAMVLKLEKPSIFAAEYQNEPIEDELIEDCATPEIIRERVNGYERGLVAKDAEKITAFIDVQGDLLYWLVCAWSDDFTGYILNYGSYPDQRRRYFTLREAGETLSKKYGGGQESGWLQGVRDLADAIDVDYKRADGVLLRPSLILIDSKYGASQSTIYSACDQYDHEGRLLPSRGVFIGANTQPFNDRKPTKSDKPGFNWRMSQIPDNPKRRAVAYDANFWKSFVHERLCLQLGDRGGLSVFEAPAGHHDMLADQICAEIPTRLMNKNSGREVVQWALPPAKPDNHFLDCLSGCAVAASVSGISAEGHQRPSAGRTRRVFKLSELQGRR